MRPWNAHRVRVSVRSKPIILQRSARLLRSRNAPARPELVSVGADALAFIVGLTLSFSVRFVGELPVAEFLMLLMLPLLLMMRGARLNRFGIRCIYLLMSLWFANQVFADIYRETASVNWMRGDGGIIFFAIDLAFLAILLCGNERRKLVFIVGFAVGSLLAARYVSSNLVDDDPWKFGYSTGVNILAVLGGSYLLQLRRYLLCAALLAGIVAINLTQNFRSPVLILLIAAAFTVPLIPERIGQVRLLPRAGTRARIAVLCSLVIAASAAAVGLVHLATASGVMSEDAQAKNKSQSQVGLLLGGRPESVVSSRAVLEHPFIGWGSWAKDYKYVEMLADFQAKNGLQTDLADLEEDQQGLIPTHSHLMGAWVWAGIFGAIFWVYVFRLACKALMRISVQPRALALFYAYLLATFMWDILFSPFQAARRTTGALLLVIIVDILREEDFGIRLFRRFSRPAWTRLSVGERQVIIQRHRTTSLERLSDHGAN